MNPADWLRSSGFRLALVYMALFGSSVLLLLTFIYWSTAGYMAEQADATIEAEIGGLAERYQSSGLTGLMNILSERVSRKPAGYSIYLLTDNNYRPLLGNISGWPEVPTGEDGWLDFRLEGEGWPAGEIHRGRAQAFQLRGGFHLLVGRDLYDLQRTEQLIFRTLVWGLAITLVLGLIGGAMMSRSMTRRIETINQTSREIMSGDLSQRIPVGTSDDDFDELAGNLNAMLDRISDLMDEVRRISDNIAHDLKTPLSRLKNSLELLQAGSNNTEQRTALIEQAIGEADGLLSTFNALLRIARIEASERHAGFTAVELQSLLSDVAGLYAPLAEERRLSLDLNIDTDTHINGDRDLLFQAFANLLDNAIKYTPEQGRIELSLRTQGGQVKVCVTDSGPGIPEQEHDKVLRRFYRLEESRGLPGNGLGLSLVAAVMKLHDATLCLEDNVPGLKVIATFQRAVE